MSRKADEIYLKELEKDREIIREARKKVSSSIAFDQLGVTDAKLYHRYKKLRSTIAGAREGDKQAREAGVTKRRVGE